jgi:repressor LexA
LFRIRLKELREQKGLSQDAFSKDIGVSQSTVGNWESGTRHPKMDVLEKIARYFDVSTDYLLGRSDESVLPQSDPTWINVLGRVAAGIPIEAIEEVIDREQITESMARSGSYIGLQIHGASMEPRMREGDVVIVRLQDDCDSGDTVIAMVNGDEATCKILQKTPEGISLLSTNPAYSPMFFSNREIEEKPVRIIGKVVELRAKF